MGLGLNVIRGFHGSEDSYCILTGYDAVLSGKFHSSILETHYVSIFRIEVCIVLYGRKHNVKCHSDIMLMSVVCSRQAADCRAVNKEGMQGISNMKAQDSWGITLCYWLCSS